MAQYHGYCPNCRNSGPVYLETLIGRPPINCKSCGHEIEVSSQALVVPTNTPEATVTRIDKPACEVVWLSQGREQAFQKLMVRAFGDHAGLVGYGLV